MSGYAVRELKSEELDLVSGGKVAEVVVGFLAAYFATKALDALLATDKLKALPN